MTGTVTKIQLTASGRFNPNQLAKPIADKLKISSYQSSRNGNTGTITLSYAGPIESLRQLIDFGDIESVDEDTRTIHVRLP